MGREGGVLLGQGEEARAPQSGIGQDSPSLLSDPGRGKVLMIARQVPHPRALPHSPDLLQLITWVFYFFPVNLTEGQKQVLSHQDLAPASTYSGALSLPPPYLKTQGS